MGEGVFIVNKERVEALVGRLADPANLENAIAEVRQMVDTKYDMACQAGAAGCCSASGGYSDMSVYTELDLLKRALDALEQKDVTKAIELLKQY